jgi:hypothetical protein
MSISPICPTNRNLIYRKIDPLPGFRCVNMFAPYVNCFRHASSIVSMDGYLKDHRLPHQPTLKDSKVSNGIRVWLMMRPYGDQYQAYLSCKFHRSESAITIFLYREGEGNFLRFSGAICEVECTTLKEKGWFMKEVFVSYPKTNSTRGNFHHMIFGPDRKLHVNDAQVLGSGFKRINSLSAFPSDTDIAGIPFAAAASSLFNDLVKSHLLFSTTITLSSNGSPDETGTLVYFNKDTMTIFALIITGQFPELGARIAVIDPSDPIIKSDFVSSGIITKTLASKWHLFIHSSSIRDVVQLHLSTKLVTPLETDALLILATPHNLTISSSDAEKTSKDCGDDVVSSASR